MKRIVNSVVRLLYAGFVLYTAGGTILWLLNLSAPGNMLQALKEFSSETKVAATLLEFAPLNGWQIIAYWLLILLITAFRNYQADGFMHLSLQAGYNYFFTLLLWKHEVRKWTKPKYLQQLAGRQIPSEFITAVEARARHFLRESTLSGALLHNWSYIGGKNDLSYLTTSNGVTGRDYRNHFDQLVLYRILTEATRNSKTVSYAGIHEQWYRGHIKDEWALKTGMIFSNDLHHTHLLFNRNIIEKDNEWTMVYALNAMEWYSYIEMGNKDHDSVKMYIQSTSNLKALAAFASVREFLERISLASHCLKSTAAAYSTEWTVDQWVEDNLRETQRMDRERNDVMKVNWKIDTGTSRVPKLTKISTGASYRNVGTKTSLCAEGINPNLGKLVRISVELDERSEQVTADKPEGLYIEEKQALLREIASNNPLRLEWVDDGVIASIGQDHVTEATAS